MATKRKRRTVGKRRTHRTAVIKVGRRRRRSVGAVGKTHHRRRRRSVGSTGKGEMIKSIGMMAVGVGAGAAISHIIIRPVEMKLEAKFPMVKKIMPIAEIVLGGIIALKGKNNFVKALGIGVMAGGVHDVMSKLKVTQNVISGVGAMDDYTTVRIPISGNLDNMVSGIIRNKRNVTTAQVSGHDYDQDVNRSHQVSGGNYEEFVPYVARGLD